MGLAELLSIAEGRNSISAISLPPECWLIQREEQASMAGATASAKPSKPKGYPPTRKEIPALAANAGTSMALQHSKPKASVKSDKYIHVHRYLDTGRWGAWFNDPRMAKGCRKRRLYFGTYETEYLAARAQDRAALIFKSFSVKRPIHLNFDETDYNLDKELRDVLEPDQFRWLLMGESRKCYNRKAPSSCLWKFMEEERTKRNCKINLINDSEPEPEGRHSRHPMQPRTNAEILREILSLDKSSPVVSTLAATHAEEKLDSSDDDDEGDTQAQEKWDNRSEDDEDQLGKRLTRVASPDQQSAGSSAGSSAQTVVTMQERSPRARARALRKPRSRGVPSSEGELPTESQSSSSEMITVTPELLPWGWTRARSTKERLRLARARNAAAAEQQERWNMLTLARATSGITCGSLNLAREEEDSGTELSVLDQNMRGRPDIDLNRAPEESSAADLVESADEADSGSSEEIVAHILLGMTKLL